jgi:cyanate lyase
VVFSCCLVKEEANRISFNTFNGESKKYLAVRAVYPGYGGIYTVVLKDNSLYIFYEVMAIYAKAHGNVLVIEADNIPNNFFVESVGIKD